MYNSAFRYFEGCWYFNTRKKMFQQANITSYVTNRKVGKIYYYVVLPTIVVIEYSRKAYYY